LTRLVENIMLVPAKKEEKKRKYHAGNLGQADNMAVVITDMCA
jgi:hypothetical protein